MCYSAQIKADYTRFVREYGAILSIKDFFDLFWRRLEDPSIVVPRAVESAFASPQTDETREVQSLIAQHAARHIGDLRIKQAAQHERLALAEAKLAKKTTKTATQERRIALGRIAAFHERIDRFHQAELDALDHRIFPGSYVPVMVWEGGQRVFKPMRYRCRPWNMPESFDTEYPGCYNARRDSLKGFWRDLYGSHHGVVILSAFYEHVPRHLAEGRPPDEAPVPPRWSSGRTSHKTCLQPASGPGGRGLASRTWCPLRSSRRIHHRRSPPWGTTGASVRSGPRTLTPGCSRRARTWRLRTPFSTAGYGRTMRIPWCLARERGSGAASVPVAAGRFVTWSRISVLSDALRHGRRSAGIQQCAMRPTVTLSTAAAVLAWAGSARRQP